MKAILFGIVEGITEWLPISSTGHIILLEKVLPLGFSEKFKTLFFTVIQLGAVLAVPLAYPERFGIRKNKSTADVQSEKASNLALWKKVLIAMLPAGVCGFLLEDFLDRIFQPAVVGGTLIFYGILFLVWERKNAGKPPETCSLSDLKSGDARKIGMYQTLSLIPGTSRSGATVLGGMMAGLSRKCAAEFSFFLAVPMMCGASGLKIVKFFLSGERVAASEWGLLLLAALSAFFVSVITVRFLISFVSGHTFIPFAVYRILLGIAVLLWLT